MAKRILAHGVLATSLLAAVVRAEEPAPTAAEATVDAAMRPEDPAASAGAASPVAPPAADDRTFWDIIGQDNPNPATYEVGFVSIGLNKLWGIANWGGGGFYFGAGGGIGSNLYRLSKMDESPDPDAWVIDPTLEIVYGNLLFRVTPIEYVDLDLGGRMSLGAATYNVTDAPRGGFILGGFGDLRIGSRKVKLGPRLEFDRIQYSDYVDTGLKITPLMLRVVND